MIEQAPEAAMFLDTVQFDRADVVDFTDALRRMHEEYPFLIKLSLKKPTDFKFKDDGSIRTYSFSKERCTQWILAKSMEHASCLAIDFAERIKQDSMAQ